ncbi:hypothetical protein [Actinoplanes sp. CA-252034]|uniref:hypothetical protein n=1 Tax=Actinoplanes sp. CA-252034 TaxID=3239906 RepID=UPI003D966DA8
MDRALLPSLQRSGLPGYWGRHYDCLRTPGRADAAAEHVSATIGTLPRGYRLGFRLGFLALRVACRLGAGNAAARLPGFATVVRVTTALALQGALDGVPKREAR